MSDNPYSPPSAQLEIPSAPAIGKVYAVASAHRTLTFVFIAALFVQGWMGGSQVDLWSLVVIGTAMVTLSLWSVYRLARSMEQTPWIWMLSMLAPGVNLISLLILSMKASRFLKANGLKVGLLGAKL